MEGTALLDTWFGFVQSGPGVIVGAVMASGGLGWLYWWLRARSRRSGEAPIRTGWLPYLGCAIGFGKHAGNYLKECQSRYGDTFTLHIAGQRMTFLLDPRDYHTVLHDYKHVLSFHDLAVEISARAFQHPRFDELVGEYDDYATVTKDCLKGTELVQLTHSMQSNLDDFLTQYGQGTWEELSLYDFVYQAMFVAGGHTVFGKGFYTPEAMEAFRNLDEKFPLLLAGIPHRLTGTHKALSSLVEHCATLYPEASRLTLERHALMDQSMDSATKGAFQTAILWAAQANTIPATFWSLAYLLQDKEALPVIRAEIERCLLDEPNGEEGAHTLDRAALKKMVRLESAISEALRLCTGSMTVRHVQEDVEIPLKRGDTLYLRKGTQVALYPYLTHFDPEIYEDPTSYQYDRFYSEGKPPVFRKYGEKLKYALMPFGGGVSICPGRHFARNEIKLFVVLMLLHFDMELLESDWPALDQSRAGLGILPPVHDIPVRLRRRERST